MSLFFLLIFSCIIYVIVKGLITFIQNESSEVLTEDAIVTRKKQSSDSEGNTSYYLYFEINGEVIKSSVNRRIYRAISEGTKGRYTHQGTRFKRFQAGGLTIEK